MSKKIIILIIVVVVTAVVSAGVWFWFCQEKENNLEESNLDEEQYLEEPNLDEEQYLEEPNLDEEQYLEEPEFYSEQYNLDLINIESIEGITSETAQEYKEKFIEYQDKLEEATKSYEEGGKKEEEKPNPDFFVEKARYSDYLGQTDWAIEILNELFEYYKNSTVGWNNLAKLYEKKEDYIKANEYYLKMIDTFGEKQFWGQYYYIAKNYKTIDNKEKVEEYYEKYKKFGGSDSEIEEYLIK